MGIEGSLCDVLDRMVVMARDRWGISDIDIVSMACMGRMIDRGAADTMLVRAATKCKYKHRCKRGGCGFMHM